MPTEAELPVQFSAEGDCSCEVCENATERPVVCGWREMETGWVLRKAALKKLGISFDSPPPFAKFHVRFCGKISNTP